MLSNRSNPTLMPSFDVQHLTDFVKMRYYCANMQTVRHIIPLEEIDRNCLQLSYALFFRSIHISLTFSERDVGTTLSYSDKNHFEVSISRKTNFKSSICKCNGAIFENSSKLRASLFVTSRWPRIIGTNETNYQVHHPPLSFNLVPRVLACAAPLTRKPEDSRYENETITTKTTSSERN